MGIGDLRERIDEMSMNKKDKSKAESNIKIDVKIRSEQIYSRFMEFTDGIRVLFLIHRNKEGGETNNTKTRKVITTNRDEFSKELLKLVDEKERSEIPYRIYSSVNPRNIDKAIRQFKYEQLDADYYGTEQLHNFYLDIKNRWIGCLMQPKQKAGSLFLFDVDDIDGKDMCGETLKVLHDQTIIKQYKTKNGWHIITMPFNHTSIKLPDGVELKTDALLLLDY